MRHRHPKLRRRLIGFHDGNAFFLVIASFEKKQRADEKLAGATWKGLTLHPNPRKNNEKENKKRLDILLSKYQAANFDDEWA